MHPFLYTLFFSLCIVSSYADEVIWKGQVNSTGVPSELITLTLHEQYQIKASKFINLGKWIQAEEALANDACYEFNKESGLHKIDCLKNSLNVSICDGKYHPDHVYLSKPFVAEQNRIFFWVHDTDYDDNHGTFEIEVIHNAKNK